jgi:hypothetical protein
MNHPETQTINIFDITNPAKGYKGRLPDDPRTDAIMWHTSLFMKNEALKSLENGNRFSTKEAAYQATIFK